MLELFREADTDVERRLEKVERIIQSQVELDQHARNLVERQLDPRSNEVDPSELQETVQKASEDAKDEIVNLIKEARTGDDATDATRARAIPILGALIDLDVTGIEHRYHGQLGYFLLDLGQLPEAESELTKAMEIRDRRGKSGWNYYEYKRAVARIRREGSGEPSGAGTREGIVSDIRKALTDPKHRDTILGNREIMSWLKKNGVNVTDLEGGEPAAET